MKKIFTTMLLLSFGLTIFAQYCGNSGSSICTPSGALTHPGFNPTNSNLPAFINGTSTVTIIEFKNYDTIAFGGSVLTIHSLKFDTISNLPIGLCWATNKANNTYSNQEDGCLKISGTPCSAPGQYKLHMWVDANVGLITISTDADATGSTLKYYVRVVNQGSTAPAVDTTQSSTNPFISYGGTASNCSGSPFNATIGSNQTICNGAQVTLTPTISGGQSPYTYTWNSTGNGLSCLSCGSPSVTVTQNSTFAVTVTDANNASATASVTYTIGSNTYQISANGPITFCQGANVTLNAGSGYSNYNWSNGATNSTITISASGTYNVTVTNQYACTFTDSKTIVVNTPTISNYQITPNGSTSLCQTSSVTLDAGSGFTSYSWSNGSHSQTITISQGGNYGVTVLGTDGCNYSDSQNVSANSPFSGQQVCIVSVDAASGKNVVIWEKSSGNGIDSFKIYRETSSSGVYQLIREQPYTNFSTYEDGQSNPQQNSNKYVVTTVDACGESPYSNPHQTIHLTSNVGINNEINLIWNAYVGFTYPTFNIYRGSASTNLSLLTQVSSGTLSYTDLTPPSPPLYYQIEVINPQGCVPSERSTDYSSSLSNINQIIAQGVSATGSTAFSFYCFYNENSGENIIRLVNDVPNRFSLKLVDLSGREVLSLTDLTANEISIPKSIAKGIYIANVNYSGMSKRGKILVK